jgi:hypothetical protein
MQSFLVFWLLRDKSYAEFSLSCPPNDGSVDDKRGNVIRHGDVKTIQFAPYVRFDRAFHATSA